MNAEGSVTGHLRRLQAGEQVALQQLWERYFVRLVGLARKRLRPASRQVADEEDAALSAFDSFQRGVEKGRFPRLDDRDDLWQVLVLLTVRKTSNIDRKARAAKRGGGAVVNASALEGPGEDEGRLFTDLVSREPDPKFAAEVSDECRRLLALLPDDEHRAVALWRMEGWSNQEIADRFGRHVSFTERKLAVIRDIWEKDGLG